MKRTLPTLSIVIATLLTVCLTGCDKKEKIDISMEDVNKGIKVVQGKNGAEYQVVDLGIGVLFATCNIGATSPEQTGQLFAWGETEPKDFYSWTNYRWNEEGESDCFPTKYTNKNETKLELADDAANSIMGEGWQIPREADFKKLFTKKNCTSKWCKLNGVEGFLFTSVVKGYEGNSIFFPFSGMMDHDQKKFEGQYGRFWCNNLYTDPEKEKLYVNSGSILSIDHNDGIETHVIQRQLRCTGTPIRPVYKGE